LTVFIKILRVCSKFTSLQVNSFVWGLYFLCPSCKLFISLVLVSDSYCIPAIFVHSPHIYTNLNFSISNFCPYPCLPWLVCFLYFFTMFLPYIWVISKCFTFVYVFLFSCCNSIGIQQFSTCFCCLLLLASNLVLDFVWFLRTKKLGNKSDKHNVNNNCYTLTSNLCNTLIHTQICTINLNLAFTRSFFCWQKFC